MNNLKFVIINVFVCLLFSNTSIATSISSYEVSPTPDEKGFLLTANTLGEGTISIKIISKNEEKVFSKTLKMETCFKEKYSLKDFEEGTYFLVIEDEAKIMKQPFVINTKGIKVDSGLQSLVYKPRLAFNLETELLSVNWLKSDNSDYELTIEDEKSGIFFEDELDNEQVIHRNYNFSKLPNGTYYITVKDGLNTYSEIVELR